jgi:hypothetical protein
LTTGSFPHDNFSSVYWIFTKLDHMIALWKEKNPIYFGVRGQGHHYYKYNCLPFDNLYRWAYFVMHTFLVFICLFFFKYIIYFRFCNIRKEIKSWKLSIFQWNDRCEFNSVIFFMNDLMKNKQNNEFSHIFFYWWHILYDNKTTNLTLQKVHKKH